MLKTPFYICFLWCKSTAQVSLTLICNNHHLIWSMNISIINEWTQELQHFIFAVPLLRGQSLKTDRYMLLTSNQRLNSVSRKLHGEVGTGRGSIAVIPPQLSVSTSPNMWSTILYRLDKDWYAIEEETLFIAEKLAYRPRVVFMVLYCSVLYLVEPSPTLRK